MINITVTASHHHELEFKISGSRDSYIHDIILRSMIQKINIDPLDVVVLAVA